MEGKKLSGYHRADGSVGTANYWVVIPMVFCENRNVEVMKAALLKSLGYHTTSDFEVDTDTLLQQYKNGARPKNCWLPKLYRPQKKLNRTESLRMSTA